MLTRSDSHTPGQGGFQKPTIAMVSYGSPFDRGSWSGVPFYVHQELMRRYGAVHVIDTPVLDQLVGKLSRRLPLGIFLAREPLVVAYYSRLVARRLAALRADVVVSIGAPHKIVRLPPALPVIHFEDADFSTIIDYYPIYRRISARSRRIGDRLQSEVQARAAAILVSSKWAARTSARSGGVPPSKFLVAPMGASLDEDPGPAPFRPSGGELSLLFVGHDWNRKGGPLVLDTLAELKRRIGPVTLHVVGAMPEHARGIEGVVHHGVLRKSHPAERERLARLLRTASFFFMPSRAEAYGLIYCEACAFGLPPVATDTGGVGEIVEHGFNGLLLPTSATASDYAAAIEAVWSDSVRYRAMQARAREAFEQRLNWQAWGDVLDGAINAQLERV